MQSLTKVGDFNVDLQGRDPHSLDPVTKKQLLFLVYQTILKGMGQPEKSSAFKSLIDKMPAHDVDLEWKAITDGTVTKGLKSFLSGGMDAEDLHGLAGLFDGIAKPFFTEYDGQVPEDDMKWAHNEIKDFFDKVYEKQHQKALNGPQNRRLTAKAVVGGKYRVVAKK
mgnify:CR=1 FL=1